MRTDEFGRASRGEVNLVVGRKGTDLLYQFIGEGDEFDLSRLKEILSGAGIPADKISSIVDFLIYYGFLGIKVGDESVRYIFDVGYDMKILKTLVSKHERAVRYILNPAFFPALNL